MRAPKTDERVRKLPYNRIEYYDQLGRNTYYCNSRNDTWYEKSWIRLSNGEDRETYIESNNGYWRKHWYDIHTGELLREIDVTGEINLVDKRFEWTKGKDSELSKEYKEKNLKKSTKLGKSTELF